MRIKELKYSKTDLDNVITGLESNYLELDYFIFDKFENKLDSNLGLFGMGTEGLIKDTFDVTTSGVKHGKQALRDTYKAIKDLWKKLKPILIQQIKLLTENMSKLYHTFMKTKETADKIEKALPEYINVTVPQLNRIEKESVMIYDIEQKFIKGLVEAISSFDEFYNSVISGLNTNAKVNASRDISPKYVMELIKQNKKEEVDLIIKNINDCMVILNEHGDASIIQLIMNDSKSILSIIFKNLSFDPIKMVFGILKDKNTRDSGKKRGSLVSIIKAGALGGVDKNYVKLKETDSEELKKVLLTGGNGDTGYLKFVYSLLSNNVIEKCLKASGDTVKSKLNKHMKELDVLADVITKINIPPKENNNSENTENKTPSNKFEDKDTTKESSTMVSSAQQYQTAYCKLINKIMISYSGIANGLLSATYEIVLNTKDILAYVDFCNGHNNETMNTKNVKKEDTENQEE